MTKLTEHHLWLDRCHFCSSLSHRTWRYETNWHRLLLRAGRQRGAIPQGHLEAPWDHPFMFYGADREFYGQLSEGDYVLWDPLPGCGKPWAAEGAAQQIPQAPSSSAHNPQPLTLAHPVPDCPSPAFTSTFTTSSSATFARFSSL